MKKYILDKLFMVCISIIVLTFFPRPNHAQTVKTDVVVIGSGSSGMVAALTLAEGGAKVIVFEKMPEAGGSSNYPEGIFAAESGMQRKEAIRAPRDDAFKGIMEYQHWLVNASLVRAFVDESADTIDWLQNQGVEFIKPYAIYIGGPRVWHLIKGMGGAMMKVLVANAEKKGIEIRYETPVKKIIRKGNGPVTGVLAQDKTGKQTRVDAKAVIIATGGYANNREWVKKYAGFDLGINVFPLHNKGKMGDGIRMAWEVGAAEEGMGLLHLAGVCPIGPGIEPSGNITAAGMQPYLWVNQHAKRFCDETIACNFTFQSNAVSKQKGGYDFTIFDENIKQYLLKKGIDVGAGTTIPITTRLTNLDAEIKTALEQGNRNIFVADSLDDLADKMGVDSGVFKKTVQEYNRFCEKGHDDQFAKDPRYLLPIKTPKFYAFKCYPICVGTIGGIKINEKMEVLDNEEDVIHGLYAVGNDAGGMYGDSYDLLSTGGTLGFAVNSGRIAGKNALKYVGK